jgi:beta-glucosidase
MTEPFRDARQPLVARVTDLLGRLTLREKVGQLNQRLLGWQAWSRVGSGVGTTGVLDAEIERWGGIGALYGLLRADAWSGRDWATGADPALSPQVTAMVQERVVAGSRFGIPALFVEEAPHGHQALGAQLFPTNLGAAAAWRPELIEEAAAHTAAELTARGAHVALVAGLDLLRDPRWGRSEECFGEDPLLAALGTRALVRGMRPLAVVLKHFAGQGAAIGGRNGSGAPIGPRELAEIHLPAARAGVDAGALGVMAAYNDVDGVPCTANEALLTGVLRDEWGFDGVVMADMFAVDRLARAGLDPAEAGAVALRAGVDLSMCDVAYAHLETAVARGLVPESLVDRACRRVLALKFRLGLFGEPPPAPAFPPPNPVAALAESSIVLLRNEVLPLAATPDRIAVLGPNADDLDSLLGDYVPPQPPGAGATVLEAIRAVVPGAAHEPGCGLVAPIDGGLDRARALAGDADLAVLVLGSSSRRGYGDDFQANGAAALGGAPPVATTGEGFDAAEVMLPAVQRDLVDAVTATGTPTVAVIVSGRPLGVGAVADRCAAVLYAWYPGPTGGAAIAGVILGGREPVGRLPVSLPGRSAILPVAYNERLESTARYIDAEAAADFRFGAGLGLTTWALGPVAVSGTGLETLAATARLTNTGSRAGTQIVQMYARAMVPGLLPRRSVLLGFARLTVPAGAGTEVRVTVEPDAIAGLGLPAGHPAKLSVWLSIDGAAGPDHDVTRAVSAQLPIIL